MSKIVVCFPGIGYHCDKPLLYYSRNLVHELGYKDSRNVSYTYKAGNIRGNEEKMKEAYEVLFSQAEAELADIAWSANDDVLFISKSIGTIIAASYAKKYALKYVRHILYTPLAQTYLLRQTMQLVLSGRQTRGAILMKLSGFRRKTTSL